MTTKHKIISGFALVFIVLGAVAWMGYSSLNRATSNFKSFDGLAQVNVNLSDMLREVWAQAYQLEQFLNTRDPEYSGAARQHMVDAGKYAAAVLPHVSSPERIKIMQDAVAAIAEYVALLENIEKELLIWQEQYAAVIDPALRELETTIGKIGQTATETENLELLRRVNEAWAEINELSDSLARFAQRASAENAAAVSDSLKAAAAPVQRMGEVMTSLRGREDFAALAQLFATLRATFEDKKAHALNTLQMVQESYRLDDRLISAADNLNAAAAEEMARYSRETFQNNERAQSIMLYGSGGGIVAGGAFALLIIFGLSRVLGRVSAYAAAVAGGEFKYAHGITEKGEIGAMVGALSRIPDTLSRVVSSCNDIAGDIACGNFRSRLRSAEFENGFKELAEGVNLVADSLTKVIDELPVGVITEDTRENALFRNVAAQELGEVALKEDGGSETLGRRCRAAQSPVSGEVSLDAPSGVKFYAVSAVPLHDRAGAIVGDMAILSDVTAIREQERIMRTVAAAAMEIADRVASASEELSAQIEQVSQGAEIQKSRVESTASAMTEMNSTVLEVSRNAAQASEQSQGTKQNAEQGARLVNQVVQGVNEVSDASKRLQANMEELGAKAEDIGSVLSVISDIADQTNLLALNAAIEAARAGEAGRGFAVVADEVRKLAEKTMSATREVSESITAIQAATKTSVAEMGDAVESVAGVTALANSSGDALRGIVEIAAETSGVVASIATAAEEQSATSEEITSAVDEINRIVAETSDGMIQSAQAVQSLASTAQELKTVLDELR